MVLKLYGTHLSPPTALVAMVLREKKVPFEFVSVDMTKREHKSPAYLEKQPFGQIPFLVSPHSDVILPVRLLTMLQDDDGFIVYESRAMARYIDAKFPNQGPQLVPTGLKEIALFEQAVSIEQSHFTPPTLKAVVEKLYKLYVPHKGHPPRRPH